MEKKNDILSKEDFSNLLDELDGKSLNTLKEKNARYSSNGDALHNFRSGSEITGLSMAQTCWGYLAKHLTALRDMVDRNDFSNRDDFLEKCQDSINYIRFLWCIGNAENDELDFHWTIKLDEHHFSDNPVIRIENTYMDGIDFWNADYDDCFGETIAEIIVKSYYQNELGIDVNPSKFGVYIVWQCYILGNRKYLIATTNNDGLYFEVTYNESAEEYYLDVYKKTSNYALSETDDGYVVKEKNYE